MTRKHRHVPWARAAALASVVEIEAAPAPLDEHDVTARAIAERYIHPAYALRAADDIAAAIRDAVAAVEVKPARKKAGK